MQKKLLKQQLSENWKQILIKFRVGYGSSKTSVTLFILCN